MKKRVDHIWQELAVFNDPKFKFDADKHRYFYGRKELVSVTTYIKKYRKPFDEKYWSEFVANRDGLTVSEVLENWEVEREKGLSIGTQVHDYIDQRLKNEVPAHGMVEDFPAEVSQRILQWERWRELSGLTIVASEVRIFDLELGIAGTFDALALDEYGRLYLLDWKTNGQFTISNTYDEYLKSPFHFFPDSDLSYYSIQLGYYKKILEANTDLEVAECAIISLRPEAWSQYSAYSADNLLA